MKKISKIYGGIYTKGPKQQAIDFIVDASQQQADSEIAPFYLWETLAHNFMLAKQGIVPKKDAKKILQALIKEIEKIDEKGFNVNPNIGDVHENFEHILTQTIGNSAGWMHIARSRNDQITTDQKLIVKSLCFDLCKEIITFVSVLWKKSSLYKETIMPGFTHFRVAMPSTVGFWMQSYLEQATECEEILQNVFCTINKSPLGAGASYGVNWPIDPQMTSNDLGFDKPFVNALSALDSRGVHELYLLGVLCTLATILSRLMEDIVIFTMPEMNFFTIDEGYTEGSSIMPQKMNADIAEKARSKVGKVLGNFITISTVLKGTPSGYNKDSAETKVAILDSFKSLIETFQIVNRMLSVITPQAEVMKKVVLPSLATKLADMLTQMYDIPFRQAHHVVGKALLKANKAITQITQTILEKSIKEVTGKSVQLEKEFISKILDPKLALSKLSYKGSPNPEFVEEVNNELMKKNKEFATWAEREEKKFYLAKENLIKNVKEYIKEK